MSILFWHEYHKKQIHFWKFFWIFLKKPLTNLKKCDKIMIEMDTSLYWLKRQKPHKDLGDALCETYYQLGEDALRDLWKCIYFFPNYRYRLYYQIGTEKNMQWFWILVQNHFFITKISHIFLRKDFYYATTK